MKNNLYKLRKSSGLTQNAVCDRLEKSGCYISRSTYSKYETGDRQIPYEVLGALRKCFDTTADKILGFDS